MSVKVFRDNTVSANGRGLFSVFNRALVQVPESIACLTCITQVTLKYINYTLINNRRFFPFTHNFTANLACFNINKEEKMKELSFYTRSNS